MAAETALSLITDQRDKFVKVCSDPSIEFEREASFAMQILGANEYLMKVALNNKASLQAAIINVAAIGISLNPASKLAYLVPRKGAICLDISYMGLMHLAQMSGAIQWGQAAIVKKEDIFELNGIDKEPTHKYKPFDTERGVITGVYVVVKTDGGDYLTHPLPVSKAYEIRDRSEAWKAYVNDNTKKCPWVTDAEEMIKKTCVKQAAKYWPRRDRLDNAIHHMNIEGEEGLAELVEKDVTPKLEDNAQIALSDTSEILSRMTVEQQNQLRGIVKQTQADLYLSGVVKAVSTWENGKIDGELLDNDQKIAAWWWFESQERSAIKVQQKLNREAA